VFALVALVGCTTPVVQGPAPTLAEYSRAVRAGDAEAVHALYDEETRAQVDADEVGALLEQNREELAQQLDAVDQARAEGVESRAVLALPGDERVVLRIEDGAWVIEGGVLDVPALQTPQDAVLALRHAILRRSLRGLLRVLARAPRAELEAEMDRFLGDTEDELDLRTEIQGNIARVQTSGGRVILLVREAGEWRVVDVE